MKAIRAHEWCGPRDLAIDEIEQQILENETA